MSKDDEDSEEDYEIDEVLEDLRNCYVGERIDVGEEGDNPLLEAYQHALDTVLALAAAGATKR